MRDALVARYLGIDVTTTEMALAVSDGQQEGFAATKVRGATHWNGDPAYPAFDLSQIGGMLADLLRSLRDQGWTFEQPGSLSIACRQHDMVLLDAEGHPLLPALSWQCNAARSETAELNRQSAVVDTVGRVEPRFILPKLVHVLQQDSSLQRRVRQVLTTGDWVLGMLSGQFRLSSSDALSNGLLDQTSRQLGESALSAAGVEKEWFPEVVQSGHRVGTVRQEAAGGDQPWQDVCRLLSGWQVVAGLGDNHASALGCGMRDEKTLVVSAGTSGTINVACPAGEKLNEVPEPAARFEFYRDHRLLLRMLPYCGDWYNRFLDEFGGDLADAHPLLNELALQADPQKTRRVECESDGERYRPGWTGLTLSRKVASVQRSIATELLLHVQKMLAEVPGAKQRIECYVLTGGLSQSMLFQHIFHAGIQMLAPGKATKVSGRTGPLRYKTSAYGALLNARLPEWDQRLSNMPEACFPLTDCARADEKQTSQWQRLLTELSNSEPQS